MSLEGFCSINPAHSSESTASTNSTLSVFKDETGYIWLGLYNNGLDRIDPHTGTIEHFKHDPDDDRSICSNYISSLLVDNHGRLWVGSYIMNGISSYCPSALVALNTSKPGCMAWSAKIILASFIKGVEISSREGSSLRQAGHAQSEKK